MPKAVIISDERLAQVERAPVPPELTTIQAKVNHLVGLGCVAAHSERELQGLRRKANELREAAQNAPGSPRIDDRDMLDQTPDSPKTHEVGL